MAETDFKYDVFISYSHKDEAWVRNNLLPTLEKQGLNVSIDYRDFFAGKPAIINTADASETALKLAPCDGPPYYYKVAYEEAERMLEKLQ